VIKDTECGLNLQWIKTSFIQAINMMLTSVLQEWIKNINEADITLSWEGENSS